MFRDSITSKSQNYTISKDYISKDKIREKIKELENGIIVLESYDTKVLRFSINILKSLLWED